MARLFPVVGLLVAVLTVFLADVAVGQQSAEIKYWVFFTDKPESATLSKHSSDAVLTDRAVERRGRRMHSTESSFLDRAVSGDYLRAVEQSGAKILIASRWLNAVSVVLSPESLAKVQTLPFVSHVRVVGKSSPLVKSATPTVVAPQNAPLGRRLNLDYGASFTQLDLINAVEPLERGINGTGVRLGILDTEYGDFQHDAFSELVSDGRLINTANLSQGSQTSRHGQFVASIMVGFDEGVLIGPAYGAELVAATTEYAPTETNQEEDAWVAGIEWLESQGVDVVNSSLGYTEFDAGENSYTIADLDGDTGITTRAADIAASLGIVVVNSAGNSGCTSPAQCWYFILTPADGDSVVAVGAVDAAGTKAGFSSFGPTSDGRIKPDVAAMGVSVVFASSSSNSAYASGNGTSFSSPAVAGVVAQMLQVNPNLTPAEVLQILKSTASQASNPDNELGWGIIDADLAILQAQAVGVDDSTPDDNFSVEVYPNPATDRITFQVLTTRALGDSRIELFDVLGRRVKTLWTGRIDASSSVQITGLNLPAGLYVYKIQSGAGITTGTLVTLNPSL
ncbi:MAG: S8 family serine peptidase [Rhodothermales bacterium]|nr:S8 family serine peptidase [Rhodothermales bacterium]